MSNAIVDGLQRGIRSRSPWFWPFIVAVVLQVAAYLLSYSARIEAMQSLLPETATAHDRLAAAQMIWNWAPTRCLFLPLRLLFAWSVFAFTLFYLIRLFNPPNPVRFRQFLSLEIFAEWLPALGGVIAALLPGFYAHATSPLAPAPLSLLMVAAPQNWIMGMILGWVNVFQVAFLIILSAGLSWITGFGKFKSFLLVLFVWCLALFTEISLLQISSQPVYLRW